VQEPLVVVVLLLDVVVVVLPLPLHPEQLCPAFVHSCGPIQLALFSQPHPVLWLQQTG
jgi:hypothetical protein